MIVPMNSGQGLFVLPTIASVIEPSIDMFLRKPMDPHIILPNKLIPDNREQIITWLKANRQSFIEKAKSHCRAFVAKH